MIGTTATAVWRDMRLRQATMASIAALSGCRTPKSCRGLSLDRSLTRLAVAGDATVLPELERWIEELRPLDRLRTTLREVAHALSIRHTIAQELA